MIELASVPVENIMGALAPVMRFDTTGGTATLADLCHNAQGFEISQDGRRVGAYSIRVQTHEQTRVAWVMAAAANAPGVDLTALVVPCIEYQAMELECSHVAVTTIRRGLVRKLQAQGYEITGITLRKKIA